MWQSRSSWTKSGNDCVANRNMNSSVGNRFFGSANHYQEAQNSGSFNSSDWCSRNHHVNYSRPRDERAFGVPNIVNGELVIPNKSRNGDSHKLTNRYSSEGNYGSTRGFRKQPPHSESYSGPVKNYSKNELESGQALIVYDYNHSNRHQKIIEMKNQPSPRASPVIRDPRILKMLNFNKEQKHLECERIRHARRTTPTCGHVITNPIPSHVQKDIPVVKAPQRAIFETPKFPKKLDLFSMDRIERAKYDKAKIERERNVIVKPMEEKSSTSEGGNKNEKTTKVISKERKVVSSDPPKIISKNIKIATKSEERKVESAPKEPIKASQIPGTASASPDNHEIQNGEPPGAPTPIVSNNLCNNECESESEDQVDEFVFDSSLKDVPKELIMKYNLKPIRVVLDRCSEDLIESYAKKSKTKPQKAKGRKRIISTSSSGCESETAIPIANTDREVEQQKLLEMMKNVVDAEKLQQIQQILFSATNETISPPPIEAPSKFKKTAKAVLEKASNEQSKTNGKVPKLKVNVVVKESASKQLPKSKKPSNSEKNNKGSTPPATSKSDESVDPQKIIRGKRKNELEKLQEDISKNFKLIDFMTTERACAQKPTAAKGNASPTTTFRRIATRRKSIATTTVPVEVPSTPTIKAVNKRRYSSDTLAKPMKVRRRDSMACVESAAKEICNNDPNHHISSTDCRLCPVKSKDLALHYMRKHPEVEVFCSRLKMVQSVKVTVFMNEFNPDTESFNCVLCDEVVAVTTYHSIYNHLVHHTGEFYFKCLECNFQDVSFNKNHALKHKYEICPYPEITDNSIQMWMCDSCHYVQMHKSNIQMHILNHHKGKKMISKCTRFCYLSFGELQIRLLDFDDLDDTFSEEPIILKEQKCNTSAFQDSYEEYLRPCSPVELKPVVTDVRLTTFKSLEEEIQKLKLSKVSNLGPNTNITEKTNITIQNLTYDTMSQQFCYSKSGYNIRSSDFEKMLNYLHSLSNTMWSGACYECDPLTTYSDVQPVVMELHHLRNAHWHLRDGSSLSSAAPPSDPCGHNVLRPWMTTPCAKTAHARNELLALAAILSAYKCMFSSCSFYTNNLDRMSAHLDQHEAELNTMDLDEVDEGIQCAYCSVRVNNQSSYFMHIQTEHNACRYYCPYCFYRSNESNMMEHLKWYHGDRHQFMLDGQYDGLYTRKELDNEHMFRLIKRNVKPFECPECAERFYPLDMFQLHLDQHDNGYFCKLCQKTLPVDDLYVHISEHERGPFECIYCPYGAPDGPTIKRHLADKHANEPPYVCVRYLRDIEEENAEMDSIRLCPLTLASEISSLKAVVISRQVLYELNNEDVQHKQSKIAITEASGTKASPAHGTTKETKNGGKRNRVSAKNSGAAKCGKKRELLKYYQQIHSKDATKKAKFRCEHCAEINTDWGALLDHNQKCHGVPNYTPKIPNFLTFVCYHCPFSTQVPRMLAQHHGIQHDKLPLLFRVNYIFRCAYCDFCGLLDRVQKHCEDQHKAEPLAICHVEGDMCGQCEFKYKSTDELRNHFRRAHKTVANPALTVNEKLMKRLLNLKLAKTFWCAKCECALNSYQYSIHEHRDDCVLMEGQQWFLCRTCPQLLNDRGKALAHMKQHLKKDPVTCPHCSDSCLGFDKLLQHLNVKHSGALDSLTEVMARYHMEIICPNGLVVSDGDLSPRAQAVLV